ncbi:hypothetical protein TPHA_0C03640 [Tetrapisispora phaffii CBS 4417]|uniref:DNA mismatch repair protein S5 domain-containing protein n=1 Tax=Tetrapisispora phaffii (strain ATCC 24235 / CBS 4417 / NBRC 1672 / NRRL Y-8282 / UCD 70-5) TaxID=1071381 RepID=G8BQK4_TETPH|nr:hypothetical protein TPHA_0C03640 [Tetrapisispora phaffii CBS 4417]CCE62516.1 hypothetical protein TPHA_0C03640 [Tetrapisispora phaffii CBS 4417]
MPGRIKALDETVVNKIAAGEIIISPVNALKEMMENSIDANSTNIDVITKDGGIKLLQISDDGSGIDKEDLPILCQRFTTSKLNKFEDLQSINTYGFRGEALASISHIARVTVTTKTKSDNCAWKVSYAEGKMLGEPQPTAGRDGTVILVEDLFYNMPSRLRSLRSGNDEYSKIVDVMGRYAVHSENIGFSCKKLGDSNFTLAIRSHAKQQDRIRIVFGKNVSSNMTEIAMADDINLELKSVKGQVSDLNFVMKKSVTPTFFINNRLVSCDPLRRSIYQVYTNYLPKGSKPFVYLSLLINPKSVDVNVHPTKREVRFLNQDEIIEKITTYLNEELSKLNTSKTFKTGSLLSRQLTRSQPVKSLNSSTIAANNASNASSLNKKIYEHKLVRTDANQRSITTFLKPNVSSSYDNIVKTQVIPSKRKILEESFHDPTIDSNNSEQTNGDDTLTNKILKRSTRSVMEVNEATATDDGSVNISEQTINEVEIRNSVTDSNDKQFNPTVETSKTDVDYEEESITQVDESKPSEYTIIDKKRTDVNLSSIKTLKEMVDNASHMELTNIFANLTYVGLVDPRRRLASIQYDLKLFLVDYGAICYELFYQIGLTDFANFGQINLCTENEESLTIYNILKSFEVLKDNEISIKSIIEQFITMRDMLEEYFSIKIDFIDKDQKDYKTARLASLPLLLKRYTPSLSKLPFFLYRMGTKVNWKSEEECLEGILKQIALLYIPEIITEDVDNNDMQDSTMIDSVKMTAVAKKEKMADLLENVIFPCVKRRFLAPDTLLKDVAEIANLPGLYKVFERC